MNLKAHTDGPRIRPVEKAEWDERVRELLTRNRPKEFGGEDQPVFNVFKTLANYPELMKRLSPWGNHVLFKSRLPPRDREILILRTGWLMGTVYEWTHHVEIAQQMAGVTEQDVANIQSWPHVSDVASHDRLLLTAVDELFKARAISDKTWEALLETYSTQQMMDLVFAVGHYSMMCLALNSFGVQLEEEFKGRA